MSLTAWELSLVFYPSPVITRLWLMQAVDSFMLFTNFSSLSFISPISSLILSSHSFSLILTI